MRAATRSKRLRQSQRFLSGTTGTARAYGVGEIGPDPRRTLFFIVCGIVAVAFLMFIIYAVVVIPGLLLIWAVYVAVERSTSIVVTDQGVAILARSEFNGRPRKFVALLPATALMDPTVVRSGRYVHLPNYRLWLRGKEFELLTSVLADAAVPMQRPAPTPTAGYSPYPPPPVGTPSDPLPTPSGPGDPTPAREPDGSYWAGRTGPTAPGAPAADDSP
jgi:hypothetical protein